MPWSGPRPGSGTPTPTGRPTVEASEAEHRAVRALLDREELDTGEPAWIDTGGGRSEVVSTVIPSAEEQWDGPTDAELDRMHAGVQTARSEGGFWQPAAAQQQWRRRDEPGPDGRRWQLRDVTGESSGVADAYGSTHASGYDWWARETDPTAEHGLTGAEGPVIVCGPVRSADTAAQVLAARTGRPLDQARADVADYLDQASTRLGTRVDGWGLDDADLDDLAAIKPALPPATPAVPPNRDRRRPPPGEPGGDAAGAGCGRRAQP